MKIKLSLIIIIFFANFRFCLGHAQEANIKSVKSQSSIASEALSYSLVALNRTPVIDPGGKLEIEVFLSGYGSPNRNKLFVQWSSPYVIDTTEPGRVSYYEFLPEKAKALGRKYFVDEEKRGIFKVNEIGMGFSLDESNFLPIRLPEKVGPTALRGVVSEQYYGGHPPLLVQLNIAKDAEPGDYEIAFVFTYGDRQNLSQDAEKAKFHITSWWERNQAWIITIACLIALLSLIIAALPEFRKYYKAIKNLFR